MPPLPTVDLQRAPAQRAPAQRAPAQRAGLQNPPDLGRLRGTLAGVLLVAALATGCEAQPSRGDEAVAANPSSTAKPQFVPRPAAEPLRAFIARESARAAAEQRRAIVYVGAPWCEPCQRFHQAVERGELDDELAGLLFLEFDVERDGGELQAAGYGSRLVPLFAVPSADGTASAQRLEGSVKGPQAVRENLLPRLRQMLQAAR